jgi:hypothetical protein
MSKKVPFFISPHMPQAGLLQRVLGAVYAKQQQSRLWHVRIFAFTAIVSAVALIPVITALVKAFTASNFSTYLSLIFSDGTMLAAYWRDVLASLVESLPAVSLMLTLALIGTLLWSLRAVVMFTAPVSRNFSNA